MSVALRTVAFSFQKSIPLQPSLRLQQVDSAIQVLHRFLLILSSQRVAIVVISDSFSRRILQFLAFSCSSQFFFLTLSSVGKVEINKLRYEPIKHVFLMKHDHHFDFGRDSPAQEIKIKYG